MTKLKCQNGGWGRENEGGGGVLVGVPLGTILSSLSSLGTIVSGMNALLPSATVGEIEDGLDKSSPYSRVDWKRAW